MKSFSSPLAIAAGVGALAIVVAACVHERTLCAAAADELIEHGQAFDPLLLSQMLMPAFERLANGSHFKVSASHHVLCIAQLRGKKIKNHPLERRQKPKNPEKSVTQASAPKATRAPLIIPPGTARAQRQRARRGHAPHRVIPEEQARGPELRPRTQGQAMPRVRTAAAAR